MKKNIITTIVTLSMVATVFAGCGNSEPTKTDTKSDSVVVSESTEIISEDTENISEDSEIVSENTEVVVAAGDEVVFDDRGYGTHPKYKNIGFEEFWKAHFNQNDGFHPDWYHMSDCNYDYLLTIYNYEENDGTSINDLNSYVSYLKDLDTKYFESGVFPCTSNYELVNIGDYTLVKVTTDREGYIFTEYRFPIDLNGDYVHDGKYSFISFSVNEYADANTDTDPKVDENGYISEEGVLEALEVLHY